MRAFQGIGSAALISGAVVLVGDFWSAAERPRVLGRNAAVMTFGLTVYPLLGGILTGFGGWRAPFLLTLAAIPLARWVVQAVPAGVRSTGTRPWRLREAIAAVRRRDILAALGATLVLHLLLFGAIYTVLPLYVDAELDLRPVAMGIVLSLPALTATGAALLLGRLRERLCA